MIVCLGLLVMTTHCKNTALKEDFYEKRSAGNLSRDRFIDCWL